MDIYFRLLGKKIKKQIKKIIPKSIIAFSAKLIRLAKYNNYNSSEYWKKRAVEDGERAVMWSNLKYNELYRKLQKNILSDYVKKIRQGGRILDIGAGIGIVSNMLCEINKEILIDAVDFNEMTKVAKKNVISEQVNFISSSAEDFIQKTYKYDLILSSGVYSIIRNIKSLEQSLENAVAMLEDDGIILMIDPFHRWNYLARAKYGSADVINFMKKQNIKLIKKSGMLFWPFREWLAGSEINDEKLEKIFIFGENLLKIMGTHFWADYKILAFKK